MNRGYIKFWRKAQDSESWQRGLMYQGLIINLLSRASWKNTTYQGRELGPGQFGMVMSQFAESLDVPRENLRRMLRHLEADNFLKIDNVGNRFVVITIVNWRIYQDSEKEFGQQLPSGQPMVNHDGEKWVTENPQKEHGQNDNPQSYDSGLVNHWVTNGYPRGEPFIRNKEVKKKEDNNNTHSSNYPRAREDENSVSGVGMVFAEPPIEFLELRQAWDKHARAEAPLAGIEEYWQLKKARRWPGNAHLLDAIIQLKEHDAQWQRGFAPGLGRFLRERGWEKPPDSRVRAGPEGPPGKPRPDDVVRRNAEISRKILEEQNART